MPTDPTTTVYPGLEGVIACETSLSHVDGERGELLIGGFPLEILAPAATFLETVFLLWNQRLPTATELGDFDKNVRAERNLGATTRALLLELASEKTGSPMDWLRSAAATLQVEQNQTGGARPTQDAIRILGALPTIIAHAWRLNQGLEPVAPNPELDHATNYLYMLSGKPPSADRARALDTYFNTVIDHGMNASTFTARVIVSTHSDLVSAIVGAIGALKGPLHGGAPGPALDMVFDIRSADRAESYLRQKIDSGERLMGFGHRVYKVRDPRAEVLSEAVERLVEEQSNKDSAEAQEMLDLYALTKVVEETAIRLLEEFKPGRRLQTNVEFYTALLLHSVGLPKELFTPTFALARAGGWCAHAFEQLEHGRLIRPRALYTGPLHKDWPALASRS